MLKNFQRATRRTIIEYEIVFLDANDSGYRFDCDENGNLLQSEEDAPQIHKNYRNCMAHPELYERHNELVRRERKVTDSACGTCYCGNEITLISQHMGACQCSKCGRWYNLFGQELLDPSQWLADEF
jgi:hypothetical protein